jgi:hypothetical protein
VDLARFWIAQGGVSLGIIGNTAHTKGYHLGADRIFDGGGPGIGWDDYSVKLARDKAGLTNAASAIDLGKLDGSLGELRRFSRWLVRRCQAKADGYRDVREVIYWNPDTAAVERWSGVDGLIHTGPGQGDLSHRTHTHISYYRDSEGRDKRPLFAPFFAPDIPDTGTEDPVGLSIRLLATRDETPLDVFGTAKLDGEAHNIHRVADAENVQLPARTDLGVVQRGKWLVDEAENIDVVAFNHDGQLHVARLSHVTFKGLAAPDCAAAVEAALAPIPKTLTIVTALTVNGQEQPIQTASVPVPGR